MKELMKAIVLSDGELVVQNLEKPEHTEPGHLIIKMNAATINSGDKFFLKFPSPPGAAKGPYNIRGASGSGIVLQIGDGVPEAYMGKNVTVYRNLQYSESIIGTWSEYTHLHYLDCVILPDNVDPNNYSGSMVNVITPFAFLKQIIAEGHKGIISTAGNSATGIAMLGFCLSYNFPLLSIVRNQEAKKELEELGATNVVVQSDEDFNQQLTEKALSLNATAIFDGIGGAILNKILTLIPNNSVIYSYGYIGDSVALTFQASVLAMKNITIKPFSNFMSETVRNGENLKNAIKDIEGLIHLPHFRTKVGKKYKLEDVNEALLFKGTNGSKATFVFE